MQLCTRDSSYPISEDIAALLPEDPVVRTVVLSDRTAGAAIMAITDVKVYSASIRGKAANMRWMFACIILDGVQVVLATVLEDQARAWLVQRDVRVPAQPRTKDGMYFQSLILKRLMEQSDDKDLVKHALERLKRIIRQHAARRR